VLSRRGAVPTGTLEPLPQGGADLAALRQEGFGDKEVGFASRGDETVIRRIMERRVGCGYGEARATESRVPSGDYG
jgi:hypothetical protein